MSNPLSRLSLLVALAGLATACGESPAAVDGGADAGTETGDAGPADSGCVACVDSGADDGGNVDAGTGLVVPPTYAFESRFTAGASSVSYSGQVARQVLALDLRRFVDALDGSIAAGTYAPRDVDGVAGDETMAETVLFDIAFLFDAPTAGRDARAHGVTVPTGLTLAQTTYGELSATAFLREKVAGNDAVTDHRDWSSEFVGFSDPSLFRGAAVDISTPTGVLEALFSTLAANAQDAYDGVSRTGPGGVALPVHLTAEGLHIGQLIEKLLLGALAFSQGVDDYLDDEPEPTPKGLLSPNTQDGTNAYSTLEHAWDEAYGYFGAPRHVSMIELAALTGTDRHFDADGDSTIDLRSEYLYPTARYAALRDQGSAATARTTFLADADLAFRTGRAIITGAGDTLTAAEMDALVEQRDVIVAAWEATLAASSISYINRVIQQTLAIDTPGTPVAYAFATHAAAWSEMKAFTLAFQFHRRSPMLVSEGGEERFQTLHALLGNAPVLATATPEERAAYVADLVTARALIASAYGFDAANVGDASGAMGW